MSRLSHSTQLALSRAMPDKSSNRPLNSIGMPYYTTPLLSLLPASMDFVPSPAHHRRVPLDPSVLATVKTVDFVGYAAYPAAVRAAGRRNQVQATKGGKRRAGVDAPMFRSDKERADLKKKRDRVVSVRLTRLLVRLLNAADDVDRVRRRRRPSKRRKRRQMRPCRIITARSRSSTAGSESRTLTLGAFTCRSAINRDLR